MVLDNLSGFVVQRAGGSVMRAFRELLALPFILIAFVGMAASMVLAFVATVIEGPKP